MNHKHTSILNIIEERASKNPDDHGISFLNNSGEVTESYTIGSLVEKSHQLSLNFQKFNPKGKRFLLLYNQGLDFVIAFLGVLFSRGIAVTAYPPRNKKHIPRINSIINDCDPVALLTSNNLSKKIDKWLDNQIGSDKPIIATNDLNLESSGDWKPKSYSSQDIAFLQYTSGSTSDPKGVMISHANLLHNSLCLQETFGLSRDSCSVSWLPSFHDMGLIDGVLQPLVHGYKGYIMSPIDFIRDPALWLRCIHKYSATHCGGPNFGYDSCINSVQESDIEVVDLSRWESAYNGSEPIRHHTINNFAEKFAPFGFQMKSFYPCYGLAEATLIVSGSDLHEEPESLVVDKKSLEQNKIVQLNFGDKGGHSLVSSGYAVPDTQIKIVEPDTHFESKEGRIGEVWCKGPSVSEGYWKNLETSKEIFDAYIVPEGIKENGALNIKDGPYMRTGDLGFFNGSDLYITGRYKELIILDGRNHYPQDIELTSQQSIENLRKGIASSFSIENDERECLVIIQEIPGGLIKDLDFFELSKTIFSRVVKVHETKVEDILLVKPLIIPRTSSGKIQRLLCRDMYLNKRIEYLFSYKEYLQNKKESNQSSNNINESRLEKSNYSYSEILDWILNKLSVISGINKNEIDPDESFNRYGVDSKNAIKLSGELETYLGQAVPPSIAYDYPSPNKLTAFLFSCQKN